MVKDEWVQAAITDDNVVVELLVRLRQAQAAPSAPKSELKWGMRQRRSRPTLLRCYAKRDGGSPTTPLCWSGGSLASPSAAADVSEETGTHLLRSSPVAPSRSKGSASSETDRTGTKRSRKKKTFAELEEENLLLKERVHLEKVCVLWIIFNPIMMYSLGCNSLILQSSSLFIQQEQHRLVKSIERDELERIRLGLNSVDTAKNSSLIDDEPETVSCPKASSSLDSTLDDEDDRKPVVDSHNVGKSIFVLPDLNMVPAEDDSCPEALYGTS
ncbi:uncharacterized protein LOC120197270 [Hibiscus syriacus]|uniref:uncharacterized protein LOC120197270 n=1 Tax=Hibiscus syriacus TaxID=106335 RepID=UPI001920993F|nr:uncharacterized protein LOC120197270 [Hibiscus syriacus]